MILRELSKNFRFYGFVEPIFVTTPFMSRIPPEIKTFVKASMPSALHEKLIIPFSIETKPLSESSELSDFRQSPREFIVIFP